MQQKERLLCGIIATGCNRGELKGGVQVLFELPPFLYSGVALLDFVRRLGMQGANSCFGFSRDVWASFKHLENMVAVPVWATVNGAALCCISTKERCSRVVSGIGVGVHQLALTNGFFNRKLGRE